MSTSNTVIELRTSTVFLREDGIMQVDTFTNCEFSLSDAVENISAQAVLAAGVKRPLMVNMGSIKSMDREARAYLAGVEAEKNVSATALVISSPIGRVIGNFMLGMNKTLYPTRLFTSAVEALQWLKGFIK